MLHNYLKIALRNLNRQKIYSLINISGLAIGMASFILIMLYVGDEISYDRFHENANNIYRVAFEAQIMEDFLDVAVSAGPLAPAMEANFPEVLDATRMEPEKESVLISFGDKQFYEDRLLYADTGFFNIFSFKLLRGNPTLALSRKYSLVLTESTARKYFLETNPVGQIIRFNDRYNFMVTGVVEDPPENSHIDFNLIASFITLEDFPFSERLEMWGSLNFLTYIQLLEGADPGLIEKKLPGFIASSMGENIDTLAAGGIIFKPYLQKITDIHLHSHLLGEIHPNSDISYIYIFSAVAFFLLIIACINFVNLTTARSAKRAKEVGLRKTLGAYKSDLIIQFLGESIMLAFIALLTALLIIEFTLPWFNSLIQKQLILFSNGNWPLIILLVMFAIFVGVLSGVYPALYLSGFKPNSVLKGHLFNSNRRSFFRNGLVVFQFFISVTLIISTSIIIRQFNYLKNINLGFDMERVVVVPLRDTRNHIPFKLLKSTFASLPHVKSSTITSNYPGTHLGKWGCSPEGTNSNMQWVIGIVAVDEGYIKTLGMEILKGRDFLVNESSEKNTILINETLAAKAGWEDPLGKQVYIGDYEKDNLYTVVGLVKDAHFSSLTDPVEPMIFLLDNERANKLMIRIEAENINETMETLAETWKILEPNKPFDYFFLDQSFGELYANEQRLSHIFINFTILAIIIACMGLFGLSSFIAEQRMREIGIRKVFGASAGNIIFHLSYKFMALVFVANLLAWPVAYYFMDKWLDNFTYTRDFGVAIFFLAGIISVLIALLTVLFIAIRASLTNPSASLRYE
jgi:putative ABC transport system permease protein